MNICTVNLLSNAIKNSFKNVLRLTSTQTAAAEAEPRENLVSTQTTTTTTTTEEPRDKLYKYIELELRGNDPAVLRSYAKFSEMTGSHLDLETKTWALRKPLHDRLTVLKSVHIYKKHRVQYEFRTYFHFIKFTRITQSSAETVLEYLQRNLPEGVAMKAKKVELQTMPDYLQPPK